MPANPKSPIVSTAWLEEHLRDADLRILDVRWRSRIEQGRGVSYDDHEGYLAGHIPGALFVGMVRDLSDPNHPVPDMLVGPERFAAVMGRLGIGDNTRVIVYDGLGLPQGSARLWWALNVYGHENVQVLDGGLRQWQREGRRLSQQVPHIARATFTAKRRPGWIAEKEDVLAAVDGSGELLIDCLSADQYAGARQGHLWGMKPGHIPGAVNVPAYANIDRALATATYAEREAKLKDIPTYALASVAELAELYRAAGVTPDRKVITYCGRGYAAATNLLALKLIGHQRVRLYDGSWSEWSADSNLPIVAAER